jgi:hypothetical protein
MSVVVEPKAHCSVCPVGREEAEEAGDVLGNLVARLGSFRQREVPLEALNQNLLLVRVGVIAAVAAAIIASLVHPSPGNPGGLWLLKFLAEPSQFPTFPQRVDFEVR